MARFAGRVGRQAPSLLEVRELLRRTLVDAGYMPVLVAPMLRGRIHGPDVAAVDRSGCACVFVLMRKPYRIIDMLERTHAYRAVAKCYAVATDAGTSAESTVRFARYGIGLVRVQRTAAGNSLEWYMDSEETAGSAPFAEVLRTYAALHCDKPGDAVVPKYTAQALELLHKWSEVDVGDVMQALPRLCQDVHHFRRVLRKCAPAKYAAALAQRRRARDCALV